MAINGIETGAFGGSPDLSFVESVCFARDSSPLEVATAFTCSPSADNVGPPAGAKEVLQAGIFCANEEGFQTIVFEATVDYFKANGILREDYCVCNAAFLRAPYTIWEPGAGWFGLTFAQFQGFVLPPVLPDSDPTGQRFVPGTLAWYSLNPTAIFTWLCKWGDDNSFKMTSLVLMKPGKYNCGCNVFQLGGIQSEVSGNYDIAIPSLVNGVMKCFIVTSDFRIALDVTPVGAGIVSGGSNVGFAPNIVPVNFQISTTDIFGVNVPWYSKVSMSACTYNPGVPVFDEFFRQFGDFFTAFLTYAPYFYGELAP